MRRALGWLGERSRVSNGWVAAVMLMWTASICRSRPLLLAGLAVMGYVVLSGSPFSRRQAATLATAGLLLAALAERLL